MNGWHRGLPDDVMALYSGAMKTLAISCSLDPDSRSRQLALAAIGHLRHLRAEAMLLDLRDLGLPMCDGDEAFEAPVVGELASQVRHAGSILLATPVYNYNVSAAAKNMIELTGKAWTGKVVGFLCAAGGRSSYMSVMGLANSLMLDFRCLIVPRFVYATGEDYQDGRLVNEKVRSRIQELCETTLKLAEVFNPLSTEPSTR